MANFNERVMNDFFKKEREYKTFSDDTKKKINEYYKKVSKPSEPEWHDIEADPTDLPQCKTEVVIELSMPTGEIYHMVAIRIHDYEFAEDYWQIYDGLMFPLNQFHAWKYITPYKK